MVRKQKGGLKLIMKEGVDNSGFNPVFDMLQNPDSKIKLLTYASLTGFMIEMNLSDSISRYLTMGSGTRFNKIVNNYIFKFAVLSDTSARIPNYKEKNKICEKRINYFNEAKTQQSIWEMSIRGGKEEICPSVANFSIFSNTESKKLLKFLIKKSEADQDVKDIFLYLNSLILNTSKSYEIGVILMPKVNDSISVYEFMKSGPLEEDVHKVYANFIAQTVRLFVEVGIIHFDLHLNNALIYNDTNGNFKCLIIDFGRVSNILDDKSDTYLTIAAKETLRIERDNIMDMVIGIKQVKKVEFMTYILDLIKRINNMGWYANLAEKLSPEKKNKIFSDAYDLLKGLMTVTSFNSMQKNTIKSYEAQGFFVNFSKDISEFQGSIPCSIDDVEESSDGSSVGCSIMGGKRRKTQKYLKKKRSLKKSYKKRKSVKHTKNSYK